MRGMLCGGEEGSEGKIGVNCKIDAMRRRVGNAARTCQVRRHEVSAERLLRSRRRAVIGQQPSSMRHVATRSAERGASAPLPPCTVAALPQSFFGVRGMFLIRVH